jgi:hypothetical protein
MPCNCGDKTKQSNYVYTDPKGRQATYRTEYEAKAAKARNKGLGSIQSVPKT